MQDRVQQARAAIERELRVRLERDRGMLRGAAETTPRAHQVRLQCLACNGICTADALFCVHCGTKFNAKVVAP